MKSKHHKKNLKIIIAVAVILLVGVLASTRQYLNLHFADSQAKVEPNQAFLSPSWVVSGGMNGGLGGVRGSSIVGEDLVLVGRFSSAGPARRGSHVGLARNGFLILNKDSGVPSAHDFDPQVNGSIEAIDCDGYDCVVAGGFTTFKGITVNQIAKFNILTGAVDKSFRPPLVYQGSYLTLLYRNGVVYAGGNFASFQNSAGQIIGRSYLAAFDSQGQLTSWNPTANREVYRLRMAPNGTIFAAGSFDVVGNTNREGFVEITPKGVVTQFHPTPPVGNSGVVGRDIGFYNNQIILAGHYQIMAGNNHNGLAMVTASGLDTGWNAQTSFNFSVKTIAVLNNSLYISFNSNEVGGQTRKRFAELSLQTGLVSPLMADVTVDSYSDDSVGVRDIQAVDQAFGNRQLYVTGLYTGIAEVSQPNVGYLTIR